MMMRKNDPRFRSYHRNTSYQQVIDLCADDDNDNEDEEDDCNNNAVHAVGAVHATGDANPNAAVIVIVDDDAASSASSSILGAELSCDVVDLNCWEDDHCEDDNDDRWNGQRRQQPVVNDQHLIDYPDRSCRPEPEWQLAALKAVPARINIGSFRRGTSASTSTRASVNEEEEVVNQSDGDTTTINHASHAGQIRSVLPLPNLKRSQKTSKQPPTIRQALRTKKKIVSHAVNHACPAHPSTSAVGPSKPPKDQCLVAPPPQAGLLVRRVDRVVENAETRTCPKPAYAARAVASGQRTESTTTSNTCSALSTRDDTDQCTPATDKTVSFPNCHETTMRGNSNPSHDTMAFRDDDDDDRPYYHGSRPLRAMNDFTDDPDWTMNTSSHSNRIVRPTKRRRQKRKHNRNRNKDNRRGDRLCDYDSHCCDHAGRKDHFPSHYRNIDDASNCRPPFMDHEFCDHLRFGNSGRFSEAGRHMEPFRPHPGGKIQQASWCREDERDASREVFTATFSKDGGGRCDWNERKRCQFDNMDRRHPSERENTIASGPGFRKGNFHRWDHRPDWAAAPGDHFASDGVDRQANEMSIRSVNCQTETWEQGEHPCHLPFRDDSDNPPYYWSMFFEYPCWWRSRSRSPDRVRNSSFQHQNDLLRSSLALSRVDRRFDPSHDNTRDGALQSPIEQQAPGDVTGAAYGVHGSEFKYGKDRYFHRESQHWRWQHHEQRLHDQFRHGPPTSHQMYVADHHPDDHYRRHPPYCHAKKRKYCDGSSHGEWDYFDSRSSGPPYDSPPFRRHLREHHDDHRNEDIKQPNIHISTVSRQCELRNTDHHSGDLARNDRDRDHPSYPTEKEDTIMTDISLQHHDDGGNMIPGGNAFHDCDNTSEPKNPSHGTNYTVEEPENKECQQGEVGSKFQADKRPSDLKLHASSAVTVDLREGNMMADFSVQCHSPAIPFGQTPSSLQHHCEGMILGQNNDEGVPVGCSDSTTCLGQGLDVTAARTMEKAPNMNDREALRLELSTPRSPWESHVEASSDSCLVALKETSVVCDVSDRVSRSLGGRWDLIAGHFKGDLILTASLQGCFEDHTSTNAEHEAEDSATSVAIDALQRVTTSMAQPIAIPTDSSQGISVSAPRDHTRTVNSRGNSFEHEVGPERYSCDASIRTAANNCRMNAIVSSAEDLKEQATDGMINERKNGHDSAIPSTAFNTLKPSTISYEQAPETAEEGESGDPANEKQDFKSADDHSKASETAGEGEGSDPANEKEDCKSANDYSQGIISNPTNELGDRMRSVEGSNPTHSEPPEGSCVEVAHDIVFNAENASSDKRPTQPRVGNFPIDGGTRSYGQSESNGSAHVPCRTSQAQDPSLSSSSPVRDSHLENEVGTCLKSSEGPQVSFVDDFKGLNSEVNAEEGGNTPLLDALSNSKCFVDNQSAKIVDPFFCTGRPPEKGGRPKQIHPLKLKVALKKRKVDTKMKTPLCLDPVSNVTLKCAPGMGEQGAPSSTQSGAALPASTLDESCHSTVKVDSADAIGASSAPDGCNFVFFSDNRDKEEGEGNEDNSIDVVPMNQPNSARMDRPGNRRPCPARVSLSVWPNPRPSNHRPVQKSKTYTRLPETNYNMFFSQDDAMRLQEKLFREAAERVRAHTAIHLEAVPAKIPRFPTPMIDIATAYPHHWTWKDSHARLGLPVSATLAQVKSQYRRLARLYHPDKSKLINCNARFHAITTAYHKLAHID